MARFSKTGYGELVVVRRSEQVVQSWTRADDPAGVYSSRVQLSGRHTRTFTTPATIRYRCAIHSTSFTEGMVGSVTVQ